MADNKGQSTKKPTDSQKKLQESQAQVDEVVGIMRVNVEKVLERDQKLSELDNRAVAYFEISSLVLLVKDLMIVMYVLQQGASQFEQHATKLKRKMWWKNLKVYDDSFGSYYSSASDSYYWVIYWYQLSNVVYE
ncbi:vesicle-associated membrane protein 2-like [Aphis craccivora]|uniref:Vesicle-associated membrane protein 2-like n=1 Tax=Aphis craccivora TaxID=307492 RepID=A0A6G0YKD4_APHCR|nr:vesicle-associated membrane protein 2-like [Aphis craccivora]